MICLPQLSCNFLEKSYLLGLMQHCVTSIWPIEGAQKVPGAWMDAGNLRSLSSPCPSLSLSLSCLVLSLPLDVFLAHCHFCLGHPAVWGCSWGVTNTHNWAGVFLSGTQMGCVICRLVQSCTHDAGFLSARSLPDPVLKPLKKCSSLMRCSIPGAARGH